MPITAVYASLLALFFVYLSARTIRLRRRLGIGLGFSENPDMLRAIRVHGNFTEYVPLALLLIFLVESAKADPWLVHILGATLLAGRLSHAFGVSRNPENFTFRVLGMGMTLAVITLSALYLLIVTAAW